MLTRRNFLQTSVAGAAAFFDAAPQAAPALPRAASANATSPIVVSTWNHGLPANEAAWKILSAHGRALDAVEHGVRVPEADPAVTSVGYGGWPDRDGIVTLDACIMDERGNCGSVAAIENIMHPISVARLVMERTPHVMLVGSGALQFALENGFHKENLLTDDAKREWEKWLKQNTYTPVKVDAQHHDTIGMLAIDANGDMAGACTTSGLAWKVHGRVGDSPIIGAGMFCDNDIGAACATGVGEAVMKICGSHLIVELMRNGRSPHDACREAIERIAKKYPNYKTEMIGFLALTKSGDAGAFAMKKGFQYATHSSSGNVLVDSEFLF